MATLKDLTAQLDAFEAALPGLIEQHPEPGDFWMAFDGEVDVIENAAGEQAALVHQRLQSMLARHGRYIATTDLPQA